MAARRACILIIGPPSSGKTTSGLAQVEMHANSSLLVIGDAVRAMRPGERADQVAESVLEEACGKLEANGVLLLDGMKRASHAMALLDILRQHNVQVVALVESFYDISLVEGARGRADDTSRRIRHERWEADYNRLIRVLEQRLPTVDRTSWPAAWKAAMEWVAATEHAVFKEAWHGCASPPPPEMPRQISSVAQLDWLKVPGRYLVSAKCDGERAFLLSDSKTLCLFFRSGESRKWRPRGCAWPRTAAKLGKGTLLDGEYIKSSDQFVAFDLLQLRGCLLEREPRSVRLEQLAKLRLPSAEDSLQPFRVEFGGIDWGFSVHLALPASAVRTKTAEPVTLASLQIALRNYAAQCPFRSDGLIFSPLELPYGTSLTFKWQPLQDLRLDLGIEFHDATERCVREGSLFEMLLYDQTGEFLLAEICHKNLMFLTSDGIKLVQEAVAASLGQSKGQSEGQSQPCDVNSLTHRPIYDNLVKKFFGQDAARTMLTQDPSVVLERLGAELAESIAKLIFGDNDSTLPLSEHTSPAQPSSSSSSVSHRNFLSHLLERRSGKKQRVSIFACKLSSPHVHMNKLSIRFRHPSDPTKKISCGWLPCKLRSDKLQPNNKATANSVVAAAECAGLHDAPAFVAAMSLSSFNETSLSIAKPIDIHPAIKMPFAQMISSIHEAEAKGAISRQRIPGTELDVLSTSVQAPGVMFPAHLIRGLIVSSEKVVAAPFCRFDHYSAASGLIGADDIVEATEKLDGSFIIAFVWLSKLYTCTKRRADSEQAIWARDWLGKRLHHNNVSLQEGFTYMLEAVYRQNAVVVSYPRDECVLLAIRGVDGIEFERQALIAEARRLGLPVVSAMVGLASDFVREAEQASDITSEGWVLRKSSASGTVRAKVVRKAWAQAARAAKCVRPLFIVHAFGSSTSPLDTLKLTMPKKHALELERIQEAMIDLFLRIWRRLCRVHYEALETQGSEDSTTSPWLGEPSAALYWPSFFGEPSLLPAMDAMIVKTVQIIHTAHENNVFHMTDLPCGFYMLKLALSSNAQLPEDWPFRSFTFLSDLSRALVLLVRYAAVQLIARGVSLSGYSPSPWAQATIAKGWMASTILAPGWSVLPPDLVEAVIAKDRGRSTGALLSVCCGMNHAVLASESVAQQKLLSNLMKLQAMAESPSSAEASDSGFGTPDDYFHESRYSFSDSLYQGGLNFYTHSGYYSP
mmetsp:Transcript_4243/g.10361  ORF Transcript_4243/g.10361 Transcript_4243/m.10361 type:complete len:1201 (+) Transcript_4243:76-3678(+)